MKPGGTLMRSRVISPNVTASRWRQIASSGQPSTSLRVFGSRACQKYRTNSNEAPAAALLAAQLIEVSTGPFALGGLLLLLVQFVVDPLRHLQQTRRWSRRPQQ
jgi:hypothetical protein